MGVCETHSQDQPIAAEHKELFRHPCKPHEAAAEAVLDCWAWQDSSDPNVTLALFNCVVPHLFSASLSLLYSLCLRHHKVWCVFTPGRHNDDNDDDDGDDDDDDDGDHEAGVLLMMNV
ncbi:hypothetical protein PoB_001001600 [Plakobranchus ocellatus]|uniref:Uncharacterized protein n=1 Tax=Plakobranchus ocellatus TaxID=259542 RepID=A0AAV3Y8D0_9GAST|nr:hypothetical protein PoB_001001600 [Plakobranchus ocellatus]